MNDFKELLADRASTIKAPVLDYDTITRAGNQRVRRRRAAGIGATALVLGAVALATPLVLDGTGSGSRNDPNGFVASEAKPLTWAQGSVIHAGSQSVDVGHRVSSFVEVPDGYVFTDEQQTVWHWTEGESLRAGKVGGERGGRQLASDGTRAAWVDDGVYTVLDTTDDRFTRAGTAEVTPRTEFGGPAVDALDGTDLYAHDYRGALRIDITTGTTTVIQGREDAPPAFRIYDAEGGLVLFGNEVDEPEPGEATYLSRNVTQPGKALPISGGDISPDGRYVMSENSDTQSDHFTLLDVATQRDLTPAAAADYGYFLGYAWVDGDTYSAFAIRDVERQPATADLLLCTVGKACTVSTSKPLAWPIQLPVGAHIGD